jgi:methylmalonyl-CoA mutase
MFEIALGFTWLIWKNCVNMMGMKEMTDSTFPTPSIEEWKRKGEAALKGKPIDSLARDTYETIRLKPLYTKEDQDLEGLSQFPGQSDFRRGIHALGLVGHEWKVAQALSVKTGEELKEDLAAAFDRGQTAISFEGAGQFSREIFTILEEYHGKYPYSVNGKEAYSDILGELSKLPDAEKGEGFIGKDPIALLAEKGAEKDVIEAEYNKLFAGVEGARVSLPKIRTVLVDTTPYHNGGANAVQELAVAVGTGVFHIEQLLKRGLTVEQILSKLVFQFSIGSNFFMEVAKLRAARILWSKVAEAYGAKEKNRIMIISAKTSSFTKTVYDPYVNMLRAGNEAFAAVLGGVQYLHVSPFNEPEGSETEFSGRIARNTQLLLKEETYLTKTVDPAGGSWYIESLTTGLAERGWKFFLEIEEKGGMVEALKQGWLQQQIADVMNKRNNAIFTRKQSIVGTNKYANPDDTPLEVRFLQEEQKETEQGFIIPIPQSRLSEPFEKLREHARVLEEKGIVPKVGLLTLGSLKEHKGRKDFMTGFLSPGGIKPIISEELDSPEAAISFIEKSNCLHYFICGSDDQYQASGLLFVQKMKNQYPNVKLYLAGLPKAEEQEKWAKEGIEQFIHVKSNCYETLSSLLNEMEVGEHE